MSKKRPSPTKLPILSASEKAEIKAQLGLGDADLAEQEPVWAYATGAGMILLSLVVGVWLVRGA